MRYYIAENGKAVGPMEPAELLQHGLTINSQVWNETMSDWTAAANVPELVALLGGDTSITTTDATASTTPPPFTPEAQTQYQPQQPQYTQPQYTQQQYTQPQYTQPQQYQQPYAQPQYTQQPQQPMPKTWMVESILVTLFCCLIFGILGIVKASSVSSLYSAGNYAAAQQASKEAGKWVKWGFWIGFIGIALYIILVVGLGLAGLLTGSDLSEY